MAPSNGPSADHTLVERPFYGIVLAFNRLRSLRLSLHGVWKARGYGWLLEIDAAGYALSDSTDLSCVEFERGTRGEFERGFDRIEVTATELGLNVRGDITRYDFDRIAVPPLPILRVSEPRNTDARYNFDVLWRTFDQDYAFFARHGVDWQAIRHRHRGRVTPATTPDELRRIFEEMLEVLRDNHVYLQTDTSYFVSDKIADIKRWMIDAFALESASLGERRTVAAYQRFIANEILGGRARVAGNNLVTWGYVAPRIAYVALLRLFGFADTPDAIAATGLPKRRYEAADLLADDLGAVDRILDAAMRDVADADALILDVRVNGGGFDRIGIRIANRFADRRRLAFTKRALVAGGLGALQPQYVEPEGALRFTKPVYLLTAERTASAAEILTLAMMALPNVTRIGRPTLGIFSDDLAKHLPNGWVTSLSNEIYADPNGIVYEGAGVPPQVEVPVFRPRDLKASLKLAVDAAVALATDGAASHTG